MNRKHVILLSALILSISLVFISCGAKNNATRGDAMVTDDFYYSESLKDGALNGYETITEEFTTDKEFTDNRKVIKTAEMTVQTKTFDVFVEELAKRIAENGGYIQNSSLHGNAYSQNGNRSANFTVRIPAENLTQFKDGVTTLGNVTYYSENEQDITTSYIDTESRITALEAEQATLLELLKKSDNLDSLLKVQQRLSEVNYQLESFKSQLRSYDSRISYSTITINVREVERVTIVPSKQTVFERIGEDFVNNLKDIATGAGNVFVWFVGSIPYLVLIAIPTVIVVVLVRRKIKKKKSTPPPTQE